MVVSNDPQQGFSKLPSTVTFPCVAIGPTRGQEYVRGLICVEGLNPTHFASAAVSVFLVGEKAIVGITRDFLFELSPTCVEGCEFACRVIQLCPIASCGMTGIENQGLEITRLNHDEVYCQESTYNIIPLLCFKLIEQVSNGPIWYGIHRTARFLDSLIVWAYSLDFQHSRGIFSYG